MIDPDILVRTKPAELAAEFPGYDPLSLAKERERELKRRSQRRFRQREKDPLACPDNQWMEDARRASEKLRDAILAAARKELAA